jgi:hypothetical protein
MVQMRTIQFFSNLYFNIILCENTSIISVGDWNVVQKYEKDTLNYVNQNIPKSQETLFNIMNELDIHDNWRIQNPDDNLWKRNYLQNRFQYRMNLNCTHLILLV